ncbi:hypothetical protein RHS02_09479, partial [Rhizoctonia solani]
MINANVLVWIESTDGEMYHEYEYKELKAGYKDYPPAIGRCWIESKQSQRFHGVRVSGGLLRDHEVHQTFRMSGCAIESKKRLPFVFGKQQLTDDKSSSSNLTNAEDLNTIRLRFEYVTFLEYTTTPPSPPRTRGAIHETIAKTATGDSAGLGDPTPSPQRRWCKTEKVPGLAPVLFIFHYAPYEWLLARGIVSGPNPRSPQKRKATEKSKKAVDHPMTPPNHKNTLQELLTYNSTSDSDSDVVIVDESNSAKPKSSSTKPPSKRRRGESDHSNPTSTIGTTPSKPDQAKTQPKSKSEQTVDVIDLASSDDDFELV